MAHYERSIIIDLNDYTDISCTANGISVELQRTPIVNSNSYAEGADETPDIKYDANCGDINEELTIKNSSSLDINKEIEVKGNKDYNSINDLVVEGGRE